MSNETARQKVISELYNLYSANGFITEDEALACFAVHEIPLSEIDSISEHLLGLGVLIRTGDDEDDDETFSDRSKLDYEEIYKKVIKIAPGLSAFINHVQQITPPQNRETQNLIPQALNGNQYARNRLIEMYLRVAIKQALYSSKRYKLSLEDTIQDGIIGLITAVEKYDPKEHEKFSTYAPWWIGQSVNRMRQLPNNPMYFPVHIKDKLFVIIEEVEEHICEHCPDTDGVVCCELINSISEKNNWAAKDAEKYIKYLLCFTSLDELIKNEYDFSDEVFYYTDNNILALADAVSLEPLKEKLTDVLDSLPSRQKAVLRLRFGLDDGRARTLEEVGASFNLTRERIRQIEVKALRKLRHPSRAKKLKDFLL